MRATAVSSHAGTASAVAHCTFSSHFCRRTLSMSPPRRTWGATVRGAYPTPETGTRAPYVQYAGPWGQAALSVRYVPDAGGWHA